MWLRDAVYGPSVFAGLFKYCVTINIVDVADKAVEIQTGHVEEHMVYG